MLSWKPRAPPQAQPPAQPQSDFRSMRAAMDRAETAIFRNQPQDNRFHPYESALVLEELTFEPADMPTPWEFRDDAVEFNYLAAELSTKNMTVQERAHAG